MDFPIYKLLNFRPLFVHIIQFIAHIICCFSFVGTKCESRSAPDNCVCESVDRHSASIHLCGIKYLRQFWFLFGFVWSDVRIAFYAYPKKNDFVLLCDIMETSHAHPVTA